MNERHSSAVSALEAADAAWLTAASQLVATTTRIAGADSGVDADAVDLLAAAGADGMFWCHEGDGMAGRGVALRLDLDAGLSDADAVARVASTLAAIETTDEVDSPGTGPVALGALPFVNSAAGTLVVPSVVIGRCGTDAWITVVERRVGGAGGGAGASGNVERMAGDMRADAFGGFTDRRPAPSEFTLTSVMDHDAWRELVAGAVAHIDAGEFGKVVVARRIDVRANRPFVTSDVLARLLALYPTCMVFSVDGFIGASPELLIERRGAHVATHPLAGTIPRSGDLTADEALIAGLLASPKERREHTFVIEGLRRALGSLCDELDVPDKPTVLELRNVSHLATHITGLLRPVAGGGTQNGTAPGGGQGGRAREGANHPGLSVPSALQLVAGVHPTPAVGGTPTATAVAYIAEVEGFDRGRYAGPVGWMDGRGDGSWAIGIRSADVADDRASMYAGVGLVAGSQPDAELAETQLKLQALLAALVRP